MLRELVRRDLQARYAGSLLGLFWSFVQPAWQLILYSFVFGRVLKVVPAVVLQVILTLGLGLFLASANVFLRDIPQALGMVFGAWFYLTPIVYPLSYVPERFRAVINANPLTALVGLYRRAFFGGEGMVTGFVGLTVCAFAALVLGWLLFRRLRTAFVDFI